MTVAAPGGVAITHKFRGGEKGQGAVGIPAWANGCRNAALACVCFRPHR